MPQPLLHFAYKGKACKQHIIYSGVQIHDKAEQPIMWKHDLMAVHFDNNNNGKKLHSIVQRVRLKLFTNHGILYINRLAPLALSILYKAIFF